MDKVKELEGKIKNLRAEIQKLKSENRVLTWKPKKGNEYYYSNIDGLISITTNSNSLVDKYLISSGNYSANEKGVIKHVRYLFALEVIRKTAAKLNKGWFPEWDNYKKVKWSVLRIGNEFMVVRATKTNHGPNCLYFKTMKLAEQAIELIGVNLLNDYFNY